MASLSLLLVLLTSIPSARSASRDEPAPIVLEGATVKSVECVTRGESGYSNPHWGSYKITGVISVEKEGRTYSVNILDHSDYDKSECLDMQRETHGEGPKKATLEFVPYKDAWVLWSARFDHWHNKLYKHQFAPVGLSPQFREKLDAAESKEMFLQLLGHCMEQDILSAWLEGAETPRKRELFRRILLSTWKKKAASSLPLLEGSGSICRYMVEMTQDVGINNGATKDWDELIDSGQYECEYRLEALDRASVQCSAGLSQTFEWVSMKCLDDSSGGTATDWKYSFRLDASTVKRKDLDDWKFGIPSELVQTDTKTTEFYSSGN